MALFYLSRDFDVKFWSSAAYYDPLLQTAFFDGGAYNAVSYNLASSRFRILDQGRISAEVVVVVAEGNKLKNSGFL